MPLGLTEEASMKLGMKYESCRGLGDGSADSARTASSLSTHRTQEDSDFHIYVSSVRLDVGWPDSIKSQIRKKIAECGKISFPKSSCLWPVAALPLECSCPGVILQCTLDLQFAALVWSADRELSIQPLAGCSRPPL